MSKRRSRNRNRKGYPRHELSRKRERELVRRWQDDGDRQARDELVRILAPRAKAIALKYYSNHVSREDLVSEGMMGLLVGIDRYDMARNVRLMTYASHWVRAHVVKAVLKGWARGKTGTGVSRSRIFFKIRREMARHRTLHGEKDGLEHSLSRSLDVSEGRVKEMLALLANPDASLESIVQSRNPDSPELMLPTQDPGPEEHLDRGEMAEAIRQALIPALDSLEERERFIVDRRFFQEHPATLAELGREMGVSRERSRQIMQRALDKMSAVIEQEHPEALALLS